MTKKFKKVNNSKKHNQRIDGLAQKIYELFIQKAKTNYNYKQIATLLNQKTTKDRNEIIKALHLLKGQDKIIEIKPGKYQLNQKILVVTGHLDFTQTGAAYLISPETKEDIYIPKNKTANALPDDLVRVVLTSSKKARRPEGQVLDVLERNKTSFVGIVEYAKNTRFAFVVTDRKQIHLDIFVPIELLNGAKNGEKVIVEITRWEAQDKKPYGRITNILGMPGDHETEIHAILAEYNLPYEFPKEVEIYAQQIDTKISTTEIQKRLDIRDVTTFTIDPIDAKDFDDALSIAYLENGNFSIGIHIADVSHYVQAHTVLDQEAYNRATSVYLVDRVVPMLPEILSNNVCSLRPNEEKLTFSAIFELTPEATIVKQWFGRTVICSDRRFTYEEAQEIIEKKEGYYAKELATLNSLAKIMREKRLKKGAINFDKVEVKFKLDNDNEPIGVYFKQSKEAHKLIEEFMLLANKKVSEFVSLSKNGKPHDKTYIYRVHDEPDAEKLWALKQFIKQFDYDLDLRDKKTSLLSLNQLLTQVKNKPEANMIETLAMRCMSKATYTTQNIGHYGLHFDYYTHFTSPIRRYPDVIAHRLLEHYLANGKSPHSETYEKDCQHCSNQERMAANAERDSVKYMQVKYLEKHIGAEFDGIISGVTDWGIYVELPEILCEGMVPLQDISQDRFEYDAKNYQIIGRRTGVIYRLGDAVRIKVIKVNLERKQTDFQLLTK